MKKKKLVRYINTVYTDHFSKKITKGSQMKKNTFNIDKFTNKGLAALLDWSKGRKIRYDDFTEYKNIMEFHKDYIIEDYPTHTHINDRTVLIMVGTGPEDKGFIVKDIEEEKGNFTKREC